METNEMYEQLQEQFLELINFVTNNSYQFDENTQKKYSELLLKFLRK